mgnify:CR=1 FL=1
MNKYYQVLDKILATGKTQSNRKGNIQYRREAGELLTMWMTSDKFI